jgi:hypothetical protein
MNSASEPLRKAINLLMSDRAVGLLPNTLTGVGVDELTTGGHYVLFIREQAERPSVGVPSGLSRIPASPRD